MSFQTVSLDTLPQAEPTFRPISTPAAVSVGEVSKGKKCALGLGVVLAVSLIALGIIGLRTTWLGGSIAAGACYASIAGGGIGLLALLYVCKKSAAEPLSSVRVKPASKPVSSVSVKTAPPRLEDIQGAASSSPKANRHVDITADVEPDPLAIDPLDGQRKS